MKENIAVIFPGIAYTCQERLLIECANKYKTIGYDVVNINFSSVEFDMNKTLKYNFNLTKDIILNQIKDIDFDKYEDVVFLSKSIGTSCAAWLEDYLNINVRQFFLTPIPLCLEYLKNTENVMAMVIGTKDKFIDFKEVESFCKRNNIKCLIFKDVGHSLKYKVDDGETEKLNERVVETVTRRYEV
ncbi:hypothetical protein [Inconstantimicrobium porci]|uniref:hypothetical protein n=1 Tax=Inconstantimicrobium porci TaxID=2652291 RepID=UPI00240A889C|nr:hypothetical protein [Inconstantimicrobium porci]MDD6770315.1 hypothetical protein [Inconstantimicrobium porci]